MTDRELLLDIKQQINNHTNQPQLISAEMVNGNILVKFKANKDIDLHYWYDDKVHQVLQYINDIDEEQGEFLIGIGKPDEPWKVQLISEDYASPVMDVKRKETEPEPDPQPDPRPKPKPLPEGITAIVEKDESDGDWYGNVLGVINSGEDYVIYFHNRGKDQVEQVTTSDFVNFRDHRVSNVPENWFYFQDGKEVYAYEPSKDIVLIHADETWKAYTWRIDGSISMGIFDGTWMSVGRVRGESPKDEGGFGNDKPPYPRLKDFPEMQEYYENISWLDADDVLHDRRGVSLHTSEDGKKWNSRLLSAPEDHDHEPFAGWTDKNENGIGDFYASTPVDRDRLLVKVYKKEKDRLVDRHEYSPEIKPQRRFRFTGETIYMPAIIKDGKMVITSTESVIPLDRFKRRAHKDIHWASDPDRTEVGQFTIAPQVIRHDGMVVMVFQYRDDLHYERLKGEQYSGIYVYRMPEKEFDKLFE